MTGPDARVQSFVDEGRITPAEGERLRRALRAPSRVWTIVLNPVEYLHPRWAWFLAMSVVVASLAVSQLGVRFDGALDMHPVAGVPPWARVVADQIAAVLCAAVAFWVASLVVVRQGRLQDFLVAVAVARGPMVLLGLCGGLWLPRPQEMLRYVQSGQVPPLVLLASVAILPFFLWFGVWLYRGFAHSAGMAGARAGVTFVVAIVVAELASKGLLMLMIRGLT
jgi:hypothetical protein